MKVTNTIRGMPCKGATVGNPRTIANSASVKELNTHQPMLKAGQAY